MPIVAVVEDPRSRAPSGSRLTRRGNRVDGVVYSVSRQLVCESGCVGWKVVGAWQAIATHGFADLSPPEAQHAFLELPTNRANYVRMLQDLGDYPARSPIGQRQPTEAEIDALARAGGRW